MLSLDPKSLGDVLENIRQVGAATGTAEQAEQMAQRLQRRIDAVEGRASLASHRPRVACLEWLDPIFFAGHWVPEMVGLAGGVDCLATPEEPSRRVEWDDVLKQEPEVVVVLPCGFDVPQAMREVNLLTEREGWGELPAVRDARVFVTNASAYYSRSGPRLVDGLEMLAEMIHPELFTGMVPLDGAMRLQGDVFKVG